MSLKLMLCGKSERDKAFQMIIQRNLPGKEQFEATHGAVAFSARPPLVPYTLRKPSDASLVGTAFDYLARAMIARRLTKVPDAAWINLKAIQGLMRMKENAHLVDIQFERLSKRYESSLLRYIEYLTSDYAQLHAKSEDMGKIEFCAASAYLQRALTSSYRGMTEIADLIPDTVFFAKLEQIYRTGGALPSGGVEYLFDEPNAEVYLELEQLCAVFQQRFIADGFVTNHSTVVFNPSFGSLSRMCGGADADIYVDGMLLDFKTSKDTGYNWREVAQLVAYYYLHLGSCHLKRDRSIVPLRKHDVSLLGIYRARYGIIEYCSSKILDESVAIAMCEHLISHPRVL